MSETRLDSRRLQKLRDFATSQWGDTWSDASPDAIESRLIATLSNHADRSQAGESNVSVPTCEKIPETQQNDDSSGDYVESIEDLDYIPDSVEALQAARFRSQERHDKVVELIQVGEVAHGKRLATCGQKSVQLQCGHCENEDNYVPVSCDSRLCTDCMKSQMGEKAHQYLPVVEQMEEPKMLRLSLPSRVEADSESLQTGVDAIRGAFGRLRNRKVPLDGSDWDWNKWKSVLLAHGHHDLVRRWETQYRQKPRRKGPPMDEIMRGGIYGIDIKQQDDGRLYIHLHVIVDMVYLPQRVLSALWDDIIDAPHVDIRQIDTRGSQDAESALMEVVGYAAKPPEYESVEDEVVYLQTLKGSPLIQPFGDLHGNTPELLVDLRCGSCGESPEEWYYLGVVDGRYETAVVHGADGDRPPP